jgi:transposase
LHTVPCAKLVRQACPSAGPCSLALRPLSPSNRSRSQAIPYDKDLYKERNLVEWFINKIKHYRRVATRYEKTVVSFAAVLFLAAAMIWLK